MLNTKQREVIYCGLFLSLGKNFLELRGIEPLTS